MKKNILLLLTLLIVGIGRAQENAPYLNNETYTYAEAVQAYKAMVKKYPNTCHFQTIGSSDYGIPVPLFILNKAGKFTKEEYQSKNVILINNAIHPGEPCGVDASVKLAQELLSNKNGLPDDVIIAIIPLYNIGGAHNRNCCSRANQVGPKEYGFRGNSKNLDLNRDFIKADSKNTWAFYSIFHLLKPAIFVDTHTSNGADYQHTMTLITSQLNKMNPGIGTYTSQKLNPFLFEQMEKEDYPMVPYMHSIKQIPDDGIMDYLETPRYSTGYTNLFNTISYVTEAHMLKPYADRVEATYLFLKHLIDFTSENSQELKELRKQSLINILAKEKLPLNWELDTTKFDTISLLGYTASYKTSEVTGQERLYYDREKPFKKDIRYYNWYNKTDFITPPEYYIIPQAWDVIAKHLLANDVQLFQLNSAQTLEVESYTIIDYDTKKTPYEGHYLHTNVRVEQSTQTITYRKGDYIVPVKNEHIRFIIETLEPHAADSYFAWNFFDGILQQKEWFSGYVFEDEAAQLLKDDPEIKAAFENKKQTDSSFAKSAFQQLYFIYKLSDNYEGSNNKYPITRYTKGLSDDFLIPVDL